MGEAVGLASGLLTLTIFAYDIGKSLCEVVSSFKSQRKIIRDVQADLSSLVTVLEKIREQAQCSQEVERLEPLRQPVNCCVTKC
jgi:Fungal N-terminal domain of STAND proteins